MVVLMNEDSSVVYNPVAIDATCRFIVPETPRKNGFKTSKCSLQPINPAFSSRSGNRYEFCDKGSCAECPVYAAGMRRVRAAESTQAK